MQHSTLVVSDPPHEEVDLEAAANLLGLDVFGAGLKARFPAPEILFAGGPDSAVRQAVALRRTGLKVTILKGSAVADMPWPTPVSHLVFDNGSLQVTVEGSTRQLPYSSDVVGVVCRPPAKFSNDRALDLRQAIASGHGPTIAEALQWRSFIDLYTLEAGALVRTTIVPEMFRTSGEDLVARLVKRMPKLRLDERLADVWPRARFSKRPADAEESGGHSASRRRGYSFGTGQLTDLLGSIAPELRMVPQYELGSRMAYVLHPLGGEQLEG